MILIYSTLYWTLPGPHPLQMPRILCPFAAARPACPVPPSRPPSGSRRRSLSAPLDPVGFRARISQALSLSFPAPPFSFLSYTSSFVCFFFSFFSIFFLFVVLFLPSPPPPRFLLLLLFLPHLSLSLSVLFLPSLSPPQGLHLPVSFSSSLPFAVVLDQ